MAQARRAVTKARPTALTGRPPGSYRRSSSSSSSMALSVTRFLFGFLARPTSTVKLRCSREARFANELKPGPGSTQITAFGPSWG